MDRPANAPAAGRGPSPLYSVSLTMLMIKDYAHDQKLCSWSKAGFMVNTMLLVNSGTVSMIGLLYTLSGSVKGKTINYDLRKSVGCATGDGVGADGR